MKRSLHIIALILAIGLILAAAQIFPHLPADTQVLVEKKYSSWSGVLRGWICSRWSCGGSFISWLNRCAAEFEKAHPGVYLEFMEVQEAAIPEMGSAMRAPELLFYSPGVVTDAKLLRGATPVCMGGYIWVYNRALCSGPPENAIHLPDDAGRSFSLAAAALKGGAGEIEIPDPGIDLGLAAMADMEEASLDAFINGELPALIVSQKELARLIKLRDAGRGPEWDTAVTGEFALADQILLCAVPSSAQEEPAALAEEFMRFLLNEECRKGLTAIGAFPANGPAVYPAHSPYAQMEAALLSRPRFMPDFYSEYPPETLDGNVRKFEDGQLSPELTLVLTLGTQDT